MSATHCGVRAGRSGLRTDKVQSGGTPSSSAARLDSQALPKSPQSCCIHQVAWPSLLLCGHGWGSACVRRGKLAKPLAQRKPAVAQQLREQCTLTSPIAAIAHSLRAPCKSTAVVSRALASRGRCCTFQICRRGALWSHLPGYPDVE